MSSLPPNKLILYHTIPTFNTSGKKSFSKHCGKGKNAGNQYFLLFPRCFLLFPAQISIFESELFWSSANALNLDKSKILSFGKCLKILSKKTSENIVGKEGNAGNQHFLLFPQCSLSFKKQTLISLVLLILMSTKCFQFGLVYLKFWYLVKTEPFTP